MKKKILMGLGVIIGVAIILFIIFFGKQINTKSESKEQSGENLSGISSTIFCEENWMCEDWSECSRPGTRNRTCKDVNKCSTIDNKPETQEECCYQKCSEWTTECSYDLYFRTCSRSSYCDEIGEPILPVTKLCDGVCYESWSCVAWSECTDGTQIRTCSDSNACGTTENKPTLTQSCNGQTCVESWSCVAWSECTDGTQIRTCSDSNACGTTENKPTLTQPCESSTSCDLSSSATIIENDMNTKSFWNEFVNIVLISSEMVEDNAFFTYCAEKNEQSYKITIELRPNRWTGGCAVFHRAYIQDPSC